MTKNQISEMYLALKSTPTFYYVFHVNLKSESEVIVSQMSHPMFVTISLKLSG